MNLVKVTLNLNGLQNNLNTASQKIQEEVSAEMEAGAMQFRDLAKKDLVTQAGNTGTLYRSIDYKKNDRFNYSVYADAPYAAFIEFGTKSGYRPQPELEEYAAQFTGIKKIGTLGLIDAIKAWIISKGIAQGKDVDSAAFLIARKIKRDGIEARPFFFKQIAIVRQNLIRNINTIFDNV